MRRFRLRFAFQEIDLPDGTFVVGRESQCQLTIDDPLVSREHARLRVDENGATIEDLNSRNGVFVNGRAVKGPVALCDGDRIRIGPQELVFGVVSSAPTASRSTGAMCYCGSCGVPYALQLSRCPACGSRERDDEPSSGVASSRDWGLSLVAETLEKGLRRGAWDDVERLLTSARGEIEQRLAARLSLDRSVLEVVAEAAMSIAVARGDAAWASWILSIYAQIAELPASRLSRTLTTLPPAQRSTLVPAARRVMESVETSGGPRPEDLEAYRGFEDLIARLSGV